MINLSYRIKTGLLAVFLSGTALVLLSCTHVSSGGDSPMQASFMLLDGEGPNSGGAYSEELGINTIPIFLDDWKQYEPTEGNYDWTDAFPDNTADFGHTIVRIGILHRLAWTPAEAIPSWVSTADLDGDFKTGYGKFVSAAVAQIVDRNIDVDAYLVELESNFAGHEISGHADITNQWIIEWIKWEAAIIKSIDTDTKIIVPLTPTEFRSNQSLDNTGDLGKILIKDFVTRMVTAEVSFEAFGFNIASCTYDDIHDLATIEAAVNSWAGIDKKLFVWAMGFPADNLDDLPFNYPRPEGYSNEWQSSMFTGSLKIFLDNPKFIGLLIDLYDFQEPGLSQPFHVGLISGESGSSEKIKRPAFDAVKDYWQKHLSD